MRRPLSLSPVVALAHTWDLDGLSQLRSSTGTRSLTSISRTGPSVEVVAGHRLLSMLNETRALSLARPLPCRLGFTALHYAIQRGSTDVSVHPTHSLLHAEPPG